MTSLDMSRARNLAQVRAVAAEVIDTQVASLGLVRRRFKVGGYRAALILDVLEAHGIVGPSNGPDRIREVLIRAERRREVVDAEFPYVSTGGSS